MGRKYSYPRLDVNVFELRLPHGSENRHYDGARFDEAARPAWPCDSFDLSVVIAPSTAHFTPLTATPARV